MKPLVQKCADSAAGQAQAATGVRRADVLV
jgi:hypothetical protein